MKNIKKNLGFTLIEVLTALTILAVAMLSFVPMVISTIKAQSFGNKMSRASELCQDMLEEIRRMDFADPRITPAGYPHTTTEPPIDVIYVRSYTVSIPGGNLNIKRISVSVDWRDSGRPPQNTTYVTSKVNY